MRKRDPNPQPSPAPMPKPDPRLIDWVGKGAPGGERK
jgi:hypothetical protein